MARIKTGAISVTWGAVIPGREARMFEVLGRILQFTEELRQAGRIEQVLMLTPVTGATRDTLLLLGALDQLAQVVIDEAFDSRVQEGMLVVQDLHVALLAGGAPDSLGEGLDEHLAQLHAHGLV